MKKEEFIQKIAGYVKKYAAAYEIKVAEHDGKLTVLTVDPSVPNGSVIG